MGDLTVVYYTANHISDYFARHTQMALREAIGDAPLVSVSKKPMDFGRNIVVDLPRSHLNIYRQALIGAREAQTKYIALTEDDVFYVREHFQYRPRSDCNFAYNIGHWNVYTWKPGLYSWKGRKNLGQLICLRELFIEAMEERFQAYPCDDKTPIESWAEPGKYEKNLRITLRTTEDFYTNPANVVFSHTEALSYDNLGTRKKLGELRAYSIPFWGHVKSMMRKYQ
jgi:hypothetical protein